MNVMTRQPWSLLDEFFGPRGLGDFGAPAFDRDLGQDMTGGRWQPAVDIKEEDNHFAIVADIPGVRPQNIQVTTENGVLIIRGERHSESTQKRDRYYRIERGWGQFERRFSLPDSADTDNIQARSEDGVLAVVIPKKAAAQPRRIQVTF